MHRLCVEVRHSAKKTTNNLSIDFAFKSVEEENHEPYSQNMGLVLSFLYWSNVSLCSGSFSLSDVATQIGVTEEN